MHERRFHKQRLHLGWTLVGLVMKVIYHSVSTRIILLATGGEIFCVAHVRRTARILAYRHRSS